MELYLPLVQAFAQRYGRRGAEVEDLVQVGSLGLLGAIERYDPARGGEFAAFAVPTIAGEIKRHLRDRGEAVRLPRRLQEAERVLPRARQRLTEQLGRPPGREELARELGVEAGDVAALERPAGAGISEEQLPADEVDLDERVLLAGAFQALDSTERSILYLRFFRDQSRRETARQLGMSEDRLRRLTRDALAKLRGELETSAFPPSPAVADKSAKAKRPRVKANGNGHSGRLLVRMPPELHDELAVAASREDVSLNRFITDALTRTVGPGERRAPPPWLPAAVVVNIVVLALAAAAALTLLVASWTT